ncbi:MAG TPA: efflux RND transporter periplasmic adaptor subunit [Vicinamibacterales bacterium]|nr:efflux RND transporter periplasmic adaptor subunit [Vicinamibacterales bacterium]
MTRHVTTVFALAGLAAMAGACSSPPPAGPADAAAPVAVSTASVDQRDWPSFVEAGGVLRARTTAVVSSRLLAPVVAVRVQAGDRVTRGQLLIDLDAAEARAQAARATASFEAARQSLEAAGAEVAGADAALALARATHDRIRRLADTKSATAQELDEAVAGLAAAEARATAARAGAAQAASALAAARAGADAGAIVAAYGTLHAPFDGIVARRDVDPGSMATPGTPLLVIEDPAALRLEVDLDATRAAGIATGAAVTVRVDSDGVDAPWVDGRVAEIARVDTGAPAFRIKVDVAGAHTWRSGLFGRARFTGASRQAVTAPAAAIVSRGQLSLVFVVGADDIARLRTVRVGDAQGDRIEMLAGVSAGERVVLDPPATLRDGSRVTASHAPPAGAGR